MVRSLLLSFFDLLTANCCKINSTESFTNKLTSLHIKSSLVMVKGRKGERKNLKAGNRFQHHRALIEFAQMPDFSFSFSYFGRILFFAGSKFRHCHVIWSSFEVNDLTRVNGFWAQSKAF